MPRLTNPLLWVALALFAGCVNKMAASRGYDDVAAAALADKKECDQGDKEQCLKFHRAEDRCREMIVLNDHSASGLICRRLATEGVITAN